MTDGRDESQQAPREIGHIPLPPEAPTPPPPPTATPSPWQAGYQPGYGQPGYGQSGYGQAGYGQTQQYPTAPYQQQAGYNTQPQYGTQSQYGTQAQYGTQGQYGYQQPYAYAQSYGTDYVAPRRGRSKIILIAAAVAILIVVGIVVGLASGGTTKLSHTAVEQYIDQRFNTQVSCNGGHDMPIKQGDDYQCVGPGAVFTVVMLDGKGRYEVEQSG